MPLYEMRCPKCCKEYEAFEVTMKLKEYDQIKKGKKKATCMREGCNGNMTFNTCAVRFKI